MSADITVSYDEKGWPPVTKVRYRKRTWLLGVPEEDGTYPSTNPGAIVADIFFHLDRVNTAASRRAFNAKWQKYEVHE